MQTPRDIIGKRVTKAITELWPTIDVAAVGVEVGYPPEAKFGDYSTTVSLKLAKLAKEAPLSIAEKIKHRLGAIPTVASVRVIAPGFVNFFLKPEWLVKQTAVMIAQQKQYGTNASGRGQRVVVEFISANPTGPLTLANGRGGYAGDALANVLRLSGYRVWREYYVNDRGNQINVLAESVLRRYWQQQGITIDFPEHCYQGAYIDELAKSLYLPNYKLGSVAKLEEVRDKIKGRILAKMLKLIQDVVEQRMDIHFDAYYSEKKLYDQGYVKKVLQLLNEQGLSYEHEGAVWMKTTAFGDDKDRVLIKSDGDATYLLSDMALRYDRFVRRKFDREILFLGADHHGYVARLQAAMAALGVPGKLDVQLVQFVRLLQDGREVRMSKRKGTYIPIDDLIDEVGSDAARFFFLMYGNDTHMDFDLDLAKKQSGDNPVYYVQYAHARICSIIKKVKQQARDTVAASEQKNIEPAERNLMRELVQWPELVSELGTSYRLQRLPAYAISLATTFHDFYTQCRVLQGSAVHDRRLRLCQATRVVLQNALRTMGVSAPEQM